MAAFSLILSFIVSLFIAVKVWKKFGAFVSDSEKATTSGFDLFLKKVGTFLGVFIVVGFLIYWGLAEIFDLQTSFSW